MWRFVVLVLPCFCFVALAGDGSSTTTVLKPNDPALNKLAWMVGAWAGEMGGAQIEEFWTQPNGGTMMGVNRTVRQSRTVAFEYLRIEKRPEGIYYLASPNGRHPPTPFKLIEVTDRKVVFENPEHDYPQRVIYWRKDDKLYGRIEGQRAGQSSGNGTHGIIWFRTLILGRTTTELSQITLNSLTSISSSLHNRSKARPTGITPTPSTTTPSSIRSCSPFAISARSG